MGLLRACAESRELYLKHNPRWLPMVFDGVGRLYFTCEDTIYIESFHRAIAVNNFVEAVRDEQWAKDLTRLAVHARCFDQGAQACSFGTVNSFRNHDYPQFKENWWRVLAVFPNLEKVEVRGWGYKELSMHGLWQAIEDITKR